MRIWTHGLRVHIILPNCTSWYSTLSILDTTVHAMLLQLCLTLCDSMDCSPPGPFVHGILQARILELGCHALLQGIFPIQGFEDLPHCRQIDSLLSEPPEKPKNTGVGSLSLLQQIFLTHNVLRDNTLQCMALIPCPCRTLLSPHSFLFLFLQGDSLSIR